MASRFNMVPCFGFSVRLAALIILLVPAARSAVIHVSTGGLSSPPYSSWETAATNLQSALDEALDGDTVLVEAGVYLGNQTVFVNKGVTVRGVHGAPSTVIDAQTITQVMSVNHINARVEGLTLRNGSFYGPGGGLYLAAGTVSGCLIISNFAKSFVSDTSYTSGSGGGAFVNPGGNLENCVVAYNKALKFDNGVNFEPGLGGGIFANQSVIRNCTVVSNSAESSGGGIFFEGPGTAAENCILYFNRQVSLEDNYAYSGGEPRFTNCNINTLSSLLKGTNNINADPRFVNRAGDFHLRAASPCIDAGTNRTAMNGATDFDGHARIFNGTVDIGADEAAFEAMDMMVTGDGIWVTWDVVVDAPWQQEWSYANNPHSWQPSSSVITGTSMKIMLLDFINSSAPISNRHYRLKWLRPQ